MNTKQLGIAAIISGVALALSSGAALADAMSTPGMTGPLIANPNPTSFDLGPLGKTYVTGAVSGLAFWQDNVAPGDRAFQWDLANGQVFIQKTDGLIQYFVQVGAYSLPDLGTTYLRSGSATNDFYGAVPQAFIKIAPTDNFSVEAGKLPTLIGAEYTWSFENMNIERGLVWNQENAVNRGVQVNYNTGPLTFALSWNDGMYSNRLSWAWLSVAYAIGSADTLTFIGSGNTAHTDYGSLATPLYQNNEQLYNLIYTHTSGPWTITPYLQYTSVPRRAEIGAFHSAATWGGALLVNYAFDPHWNLAARAEYITSSGSVADGAPSLIYGPGSHAWSVTVTPTFQYNIFFARAELSYVGAGSTTPGFALGSTFDSTTQTRAMFETGILF